MAYIDEVEEDKAQVEHDGRETQAYRQQSGQEDKKDTSKWNRM